MMITIETTVPYVALPEWAILECAPIAAEGYRGNAGRR
jgi:hypothetical protein